MNLNQSINVRPGCVYAPAFYAIGFCGCVGCRCCLFCISLLLVPG